MAVDIHLHIHRHIHIHLHICIYTYIHVYVYHSGEDMIAAFWSASILAATMASAATALVIALSVS